MNIWAHRGCSYRYPENTLSAFAAACEYDITGIELDIQLSKDGELVVIHDERVDRTTNATGNVCDMTLAELKALDIQANPASGVSVERIPTLGEVLSLVEKPCKERSMLVNIELKTSVIRYEGIEEQALELVRRHGLEKSIVWSSFCMDSVRRILELAPDAETGVLDEPVSACLRQARELGAAALHPYVGAIDVDHLESSWAGPVRAWNMGKPEPFFPSDKPIQRLDLPRLRARGITDVFTNAPELYVGPVLEPDPLDEAIVLAGRGVDPETGLLVPDSACATTWEPLSLRAGARIVWEDPRWEWRAYAYDASDVDPALVHTYTYQEESNWARFVPDGASAQWGTDDLVAESDCLLRLSLRRADGLPISAAPALADIARFEGSRDPKPIPGFVQDEVERVAGRVRAMRRPGDLVLQLVADPHYATGGIWDDTVQSLRLCARKTCPHALVQLGDLSDGLAPREATERIAARMLAQLSLPGLPVLGCVGNHDMNYFHGNSEVMSAGQSAKTYLGRRSPWYHVDMPEQRVRLLFLHSFDPAGDTREKRYGYPLAVLAWLRATLATTPRGWNLLVFSHVPPLGRLHHWSDDIKNGEAVVSMLERWQRRNSGCVLAFVHGHNHADQVFEERAFPIVGIGCAKLEDFCEHKPEGATTWPRERGGSTQELWDVLVAHPDERTCDFVRFGAGQDRHVVCHG